MTIKEAMIESHRIATEKGFWDDYDYIDLLPLEPNSEHEANKTDAHQIWQKEQHFCTKLALIITEISKAIESRRKNKFTLIDNIEKDLLEGKGILSETLPEDIIKITQKNTFEQFIKDTYEDELADAAIRLFDLAEKTGVDLEWHIKQKMIYNSSREKLHGKIY